jgi:transcriptional/translational regulatory protein YebC/TACO1
VINCETSDLLGLVQNLKANGYLSTQFDTQWLVRSDDSKVLLNEEGSEKFVKFLDSMDEDLDVTTVYHNAAFPGE